MRWLFLPIVLLMALAGQAGAGAPWRREVAARAHLSFVVPPGWRLTDLGGGSVVATSFDPQQGWFARAGRPRRLPRDGAVVLVYAPQGQRFPVVRRRLRLTDGVTGYYECLLRLQGTMFRFARAGTSMQVAVAFSGREAEAMEVLNGITPWPPRTRVLWHGSRSLGLPSAGTLAGGVQLPAQGRRFFTWDPVLKVQPDRPGRRWANARLVRLLLRLIGDYAHDHPEAPRLGIGDLSRRGGGDFGPRFGLPGHVSHQNGLDADVYYPRLDRRERPPGRPEQIDRRLAQDLVDRFVRAGAVRVFVGPRTRLRGPTRIVQVLGSHDNHLHVRIGR